MAERTPRAPASLPACSGTAAQSGECGRVEHRVRDCAAAGGASESTAGGGHGRDHRGHHFGRSDGACDAG